MMLPLKKYFRLPKNIWWSSSLVYLFLLSSTPSFGQDFYVFGGLNACNITGTGYYTFQKPGAYFSFGKTTELESFKQGRIYYGVGFSQEGARKAPNPSINDLVAYNIRLNYVEVPVTLELKMKSVKALVGLSPSYLINKVEKDLNGIAVLQNNAYRMFELSGSLGFAVYGGENLNFSLRASNSIFPIVNITPSTLTFGRGPRSLYFTMGVTYIFKKKKKPENEDAENTEG